MSDHSASAATTIVKLEAHQVRPRPYCGGSGIARFRGTEHDDPYTPEDFVGSTTEVFSGGGVGLTRLADGALLRDAVADDPGAYLGQAHVDTWGAQTRLLTKLLSTDERLFVHAHPDDDFAADHLNAPCGKTESWVILDTVGDDPHVLLGFSRDVSTDELVDWFDTQDVEAMMAAMHRVSVRPGDCIHVPAGVPHGIGPGITLVELQQPADLSLLLEYRGFRGLERDSALLGLPVATAVDAFRRTAVTKDEIEVWRSKRSRADRLERLLPPIADTVYRAWRIHTGTAPETMSAGFAIIVVVSGEGELSSGVGTVTARRGQTFLVPYAAGPVSISSGLDVIWCAPPESR
ncbi:class I mannose-6-phosphate isomerase [Microbacterium sp.]|uniref:class I mannose-6-phosphate isomerase n=1 Tax=Microbacterium sp. TaxID=51671 RepID=UPI003F9E0D2C